MEPKRKFCSVVDKYNGPNLTTALEIISLFQNPLKLIRVFPFASMGFESGPQRDTGTCVP